MVPLDRIASDARTAAGAGEAKPESQSEPVGMESGVDRVIDLPRCFAQGRTAPRVTLNVSGVTN